MKPTGPPFASWRPALRTGLLVSSAAAAMLTFALAVGAFVGVFRGGSATLDFSAFYTAGHLVLDGQEDALYEIEVQEEAQRRFSGGNYDRPLPFALPAFVAYSFAPLSPLPFRVAYAVMLAVNLALVATLLLLLRQATPSLPAPQRRLLMISAVFGIPTVAVLTAGQIDLLVAVALLGGYTLARRGHPVAAGLVLVIVLGKPQLALGVMAMLVVSRQWRTLVPLVVGGAVLAAAPLLAMGTEAIAGNVRALGSVGEAAHMSNLRGFMVSAGAPDSMVVWGPAWVLISVGALAAAVRRWRDERTPTDQRWAIALLLPLVLSPHLHGQTLVLLFPAAGLALNALVRERRLEAETASLLSLALFSALFLRWAVTLAGVAIGVLLIAPLFALAVALPWRNEHGTVEPRASALESARAA